jgi:erythromycin esterase-like protein
METVSAHPPYAEGFEKRPDTPFGQVVGEALGDELYSLTLVAGSGRDLPFAYRGDFDTVEALPQPPEDSLEAALLASGHDAAFLDLKSDGSTEFCTSGLEPGSWLELDWRQVYDGVLYLREMRPMTVGRPMETSSRRPPPAK